MAKLNWGTTGLEALPDFENFNKFYDEIIKYRGYYFNWNDYYTFINWHDKISTEISNYANKMCNNCIYKNNTNIAYNNTYNTNNYNTNNSNISNNYTSDKAENSTKSEVKEMNGRRKKMFNKSQVEQIKIMFKNGASKSQIARAFKCSEKTIRNYLKS